nr:hypothetical protein Iba_chr05dCG15360 [Ipomoea batatas]
MRSASRNSPRKKQSPAADLTGEEHSAPLIALARTSPSPFTVFLAGCRIELKQIAQRLQTGEVLQKDLELLLSDPARRCFRLWLLQQLVAGNRRKFSSIR